MAWTDPAGHVFVVGEIVSPATLNTYVKDNLVALQNSLQMKGKTTLSLNGSSPALGTPVFLVQSGTVVVTFASNTAAVTFPVAFPNGVLCVLVNDGDDTIPKTMASVAASVSKTGFTASSSTASGAQRVNYLAIGF